MSKTVVHPSSLLEEGGGWPRLGNGRCGPHETFESIFPSEDVRRY